MEQNISILAAFLAGILAFISPCVLPIIPGYIAYITGMSAYSQEKRDLSVIYAAIAFVVGFSIVFTALGAASTFVGQILQEYKSVISKIASILVILLGIHFTGFFQWEKAKQILIGFSLISIGLFIFGYIQTNQIFNIYFYIFILSIVLDIFYFAGIYKILYEQKTTEVKKKPPGVFGAFIVGIAFAFGWTPCIGPVLGAILLYASQQETVMQGVYLLFAFSMGLGIPFILTAAAIDRFFKVFNVIKRYFLYIEIAGGILLILMGILLLTGEIEKIGAIFS